MRRPAVLPGLAALALALMVATPGLAGRGGDRAREAKAERDPTPAPASATEFPRVTGPRLVLPDEVPEFDRRLARAAERFAAGDPWGVIHELESFDFEAAGLPPGADRAAFLLAQAYRAIGSRASFARVAERVAGWDRDTGYTRWLASQLVLDRTEASGRVPEGTDELFPLTAPYAQGFRTLAASGVAGGSPPAWPADLDTTTTLGADIAGALALAAAREAIARGEDPRPSLAGVPAASRYGSRALHLRGVAALERGEVAAGRADLESLLVAGPGYGSRRDVGMTLAGLALDEGRWADAESLYARADSDWQRHRDSLDARLAERRFDDLWGRWRRPAGPSASLPLSGVLSDDLSLHWSRAAASRAAMPDEPPGFVAPDERSGEAWSVAPPSEESWTRVTASAWHLDEENAVLLRLRTQADEERRRLASLRRYFEWGDHQVLREDSLLADRDSALAALAARLGDWDAKLQAARDEAIRRIEERSRALAAEAARQRLSMRGMRHLHLDGPHAAWGRWSPAETPSPDALLGADEALADSIAAIARRIEVEGAAKIRRSYAEAWRPGLIDRVGRLAAENGAARAHAARLDRSVDSSLAATADSPELRRLVALAERQGRRVDSLETAHVALRRGIAAEAVRAARESLEEEREGLAYGLAVASYAASLDLPAPGATAHRGNRDSTRASLPTHTPAEIAHRARAIANLQNFLSAHPQSPARAEVRFRLADLTLVQERGTFRDRMAEYLRRQSEGLDPGPLPVMGDEVALDLYRTILREDPEFEHLDAVRFNAGMILADAGDPEAEAFFLDLVKLTPNSAYAQEGWLRLGDLRFMARRFREASDFYAQAAAGSDPTLRTVATYKLGWAGFRDERFLDAATAFRDVLDLYASAARPEIHADVEKEAENYLVQALTRAGGAETFAQLFDGTRDRPHEERVLAELAQQFRRYDRHADAIATDRMALERYPRSGEALTTAQRMLTSYERWNDATGGREAMAQLAPRFAPGSAWAQAQASDSVRAAGAEFSRRAWLTLASGHHRAARERDQGSDWRSALELYETVLERFPGDPEASRYHLHAGEASARLERYPAALAHYRQAASAGSDSLRAIADWQVVAISDEWYDRRRNGRRDGFEPPADSLARALFAEADRYIERHPDDPRGADLVWREGQVALAHEWHEEAATRFGRMTERYPADARSPRAAALRADAFYHLERFAEAGAAYEAAHAIASRAGADSLAVRTAEAIPICYYRDAEVAVERDSTDHRRHAGKFEKVASGWPGFRYADLAQYRAGRAYLKAGAWDEAVRALGVLARDFPNSEYARDAHLEMAGALEKQGRREEAAAALTGFAAHFASDSSADDAILKAADLYEAAKRQDRADSLRLAYVARYPDDHETGMEVYEGLARRDLAHVTAERPLSSLLPAPVKPVAPAKGAKQGSRTATPAPAVAPTVPASYLAEYLARAEKHPELASKPLLAEVRFRQGDEARARAAALPLGLPLDRSIPRRQKALDEALAHFTAAAGYGVAEWSHASACRIGETLVAFGTALERSERPADLEGDDLLAYEDVLYDRAQVFFDRGEAVWVDLIRQKGEEHPKDPWIAEAKTGLWSRLGLRFAYRPEADYPRVEAEAPPRPKAPKPAKEKKPRKERKGRTAKTGGETADARIEGAQR